MEAVVVMMANLIMARVQSACAAWSKVATPLVCELARNECVGLDDEGTPKRCVADPSVLSHRRHRRECHNIRLQYARKAT